ncbi:hypothetical protein HanHA300_Chr00c0099g0709581 [Helianthus annuus]|nr:hypothetical protein HanHA300_Chr00c0099g0709581 [Helianthus annuus]
MIFLQIVVWRFLHRSHGSAVLGTKNFLFWIVIVQYIPRSIRILPLFSELKRPLVSSPKQLGPVQLIIWFGLFLLAM